MKSKLTFAAIALTAAIPTFAIAQTSVGKAQLAEIVGVEPEMFTLSQLTSLQNAMRMNDPEAISKILQDAGSSMSAEEIMPGEDGMDEMMTQTDSFYDSDYMEGKKQLAANLNVDPNSFTLSQLAALSNAKREQDEDQITKILGDAGVDMTAADVLN